MRTARALHANFRREPRVERHPAAIRARGRRRHAVGVPTGGADRGCRRAEESGGRAGVGANAADAKLLFPSGGAGERRLPGIHKPRGRTIGTVRPMRGTAPRVRVPVLEHPALLVAADANRHARRGPLARRDEDPGDDDSPVSNPRADDSLVVFHRRVRALRIRAPTEREFERVAGARVRPPVGPDPRREKRRLAVVELKGLGVSAEVRLPHVGGVGGVAGDVRELRADRLLDEGGAVVAETPANRHAEVTALAPDHAPIRGRSGRVRDAQGGADVRHDCRELGGVRGGVGRGVVRAGVLAIGRAASGGVGERAGGREDGRATRDATNRAGSGGPVQTAVGARTDDARRGGRRAPRQRRGRHRHRVRCRGRSRRARATSENDAGAAPWSRDVDDGSHPPEVRLALSQKGDGTFERRGGGRAASASASDRARALYRYSRRRWVASRTSLS